MNDDQSALLVLVVGWGLTLELLLRIPIRDLAALYSRYLFRWISIITNSGISAERKSSVLSLLSMMLLGICCKLFRSFVLASLPVGLTSLTLGLQRVTSILLEPIIALLGIICSVLYLLIRKKALG